MPLTNDLCNIEVAIIMLSRITSQGNYYQLNLAAQLFDRCGAHAALLLHQMIQCTFSKDITPHCCSEYYFLISFFFTNCSPSCVRYSGCPRPPPRHRSPLAAHCTTPPSPVRWKGEFYFLFLKRESSTWLGTCSLCASVKPWTCSRRGSRSSTAESSNSRNWVGGT